MHAAHTLNLVVLSTASSRNYLQMSDTNRVVHNSNNAPAEFSGMVAYRPWRGTWDTLYAVGPVGLWTGVHAPRLDLCSHSRHFLILSFVGDVACLTA